MFGVIRNLFVLFFSIETLAPVCRPEKLTSGTQYRSEHGKQLKAKTVFDRLVRERATSAPVEHEHSQCDNE